MIVANETALGSVSEFVGDKMIWSLNGAVAAALPTLPTVYVNASVPPLLTDVGSVSGDTVRAGRYVLATTTDSLPLTVFPPTSGWMLTPSVKVPEAA